MIPKMNTQTRKVVRVTTEEFELDDGQIFPHVVELAPRRSSHYGGVSGYLRPLEDRDCE